MRMFYQTTHHKYPEIAIFNGYLRHYPRLPVGTVAVDLAQLPRCAQQGMWHILRPDFGPWAGDDWSCTWRIMIDIYLHIYIYI